MSRFEENEDNRKNIQEVFRHYSQTLIMDMDVKQIADAADMIVAGYAYFWKKDAVEVFDLNDLDKSYYSKQPSSIFSNVSRCRRYHFILLSAKYRNAGRIGKDDQRIQQGRFLKSAWAEN